MKYNWNWGIFFQPAADGSGTWLHYVLVGIVWTLGTALVAWVIALAIGSVVGVMRTTPKRWAVRVGNGYVEVMFKPVSGSEDQAGGLIWRAKDLDNYYIARANALEDNVTIYHTINGRRSEKKRASMKVATGKWHSLGMDFQGSHFTVTFDGQKALEWDDDTFKEAGKVGVWTKADSVTLFDDFSYGAK